MTGARILPKAAALGSALAMILVAGACSLGDKQAMADRVIAAGRRTQAAGVAQASMSLDAKVLKKSKKIVAQTGPPKIAGGTAADLPAVVDFRARRAAVAIPAGDVAHAGAIFDGTRVFERSDVKLPATVAAAAGGTPSNIDMLALAVKTPAAPQSPAQPQPEPETTTTTAPPAPAGSAGETPVAGSRLQRPTRAQRRWLAFDYHRLDRNDSTKVAGHYALNPVDVLGLTEGALAGSMRVVGSDTIDGATVTHYRFNVSREKAERRLDEGERKDLDKEFHANAIHADVFHADAWIDTQGRLRRFAVRMRQTLDHDNRDDLTVTIDLRELGGNAAVVLPEPKETATVQNFGQLVHTVVGT